MKAKFCLGLAVACLAALAGCEQRQAPERADQRCMEQGAPPAETIARCDAALASGELDDAARADALAQRGAAKLQRSDPTAALADFNAALAIDAEHQRATLGKATILAESGQIDAAQPLIARLTEGPFAADAHFLRGELHARMNDVTSALADYDAAIAASPNMARALARRGALKQIALADYAAALNDLDRALSLEPRNPAALAARCWNSVFRDADMNEARRDAERAIEVEPARAGAQVCLGVVLLRQENWTGARDAFDAALRVDTVSVDALYGRGLARMKSGARQEGDADIDRAYELDSSVDRRFKAWGVER